MNEIIYLHTELGVFVSAERMTYGEFRRKFMPKARPGKRDSQEGYKVDYRYSLDDGIFNTESSVWFATLETFNKYYRPVKTPLESNIVWHYVDDVGMPKKNGYYLICKDIQGGDSFIEISGFHRDGESQFWFEPCSCLIYAWAELPKPAPRKRAKQ